MAQRVPVVDPAGLPDAVLGALAQLRQAPLRGGDADHRHVEHAALRHRIERRKDLLVREVAGDAEQHQRVGPCRAASGARSSQLSSFFFSSCPPNCLRIADSTRSAKSASPRELKRS